MKNYKLIVLAIIVLGFFGCASNSGVQITISEYTHVYGFFGGLWHGIIVPVTWIGSLFSDNIAIYAVSNNGNWYDFGFALGVGQVIFSIDNKK